MVMIFFFDDTISYLNISRWQHDIKGVIKLCIIVVMLPRRAIRWQAKSVKNSFRCYEYFNFNWIKSLRTNNASQGKPNGYKISLKISFGNRKLTIMKTILERDFLFDLGIKITSRWPVGIMTIFLFHCVSIFLILTTCICSI